MREWRKDYGIMTMSRMDYKKWLKDHGISEQDEFMHGTLEHHFGTMVWYDKLKVKEWLRKNGMEV
jgi:hypothetical protein